jgi:hypothetical protein
MILTTYMDESGTHKGSPCVAVASAMANVRQWGGGISSYSIDFRFSQEIAQRIFSVPPPFESGSARSPRRRSARFRRQAESRVETSEVAVDAETSAKPVRPAQRVPLRHS